MNETVQCCAGEHIPAEEACTRNSREIVVTRPSQDMVAGDRVPWAVYPLCGVYHRGTALAALIRQSDPHATVLVFEVFEHGGAARELVPGHYSATLDQASEG